MWKQKKKTEKLLFLPSDAIHPNPYQPRENFTSEELSELSKSLLRYGMLSPLVVRLVGGEYELVLGERRLRAAKLIGMEKVPCRLLSVSPRAGAEMTLAENLLRRDLDTFEEAAGLDRLMKNFHLDREEVSLRTGQSQSSVAAKLRLLRLSPEERHLLTQAGFGAGRARAFLRVSDPPMRLFAIKFAIEKDLSPRETDEFLDQIISSPEDFEASAEDARRAPVRRVVVKDVRILLNSVDRAIFAGREAGIDLEATKTEDEGFICYSIRIPKYR